MFGTFLIRIVERLKTRLETIRFQEISEKEDSEENIDLRMVNCFDLNPEFIQNGESAHHALVCAVKQHVFPIAQNILFCYILPQAKQTYYEQIQQRIKRKLTQLNEEKQKINDIVGKYCYDTDTVKELLYPFVPSKTASQALKFVTFEGLKLLKEKELSTVGRKFFTLVLLISRLYTQDDNLLDCFLEKIKETEGRTIKSFVLEKVIKNLDFSENEFKQIEIVLEEDFLGEELIKWSRTCGYFAFIIREIVRYIQQSQEFYCSYKIESIRNMLTNKIEISKTIEGLEEILLIFKH